ncbi:MAG: DUF2946 domain-containing protein [Arenimonas sp.]
MIAIFAILFNTFSPAINAATGVARGELITAELCTSSGLKVVVIDAGASDVAEQEKPGKNTMHGDHCPFCISHVSTFIAPYVGLNVFFFEVIPQLLPQVLEQSVTPRFVGASWQSRGPPFLA